MELWVLMVCLTTCDIGTEYDVFPDRESCGRQMAIWAGQALAWADRSKIDLLYGPTAVCAPIDVTAEDIEKGIIFAKNDRVRD